MIYDALENRRCFHGGSGFDGASLSGSTYAGSETVPGYSGLPSNPLPFTDSHHDTMAGCIAQLRSWLGTRPLYFCLRRRDFSPRGPNAKPAWRWSVRSAQSRAHTGAAADRLVPKIAALLFRRKRRHFPPHRPHGNPHQSTSHRISMIP